MKFDSFSFNLDTTPKWLVRILYPAWWVVWMIAFLLYSAAFLVAKLFIGIRFLLTPKKKKKEEKEVKKDTKTRK